MISSRLSLLHPWLSWLPANCSVIIDVFTDAQEACASSTMSLSGTSPAEDGGNVHVQRWWAPTSTGRMLAPQLSSSNISRSICGSWSFFTLQRRGGDRGGVRAAARLAMDALCWCLCSSLSVGFTWLKETLVPSGARLPWNHKGLMEPRAPGSVPRESRGGLLVSPLRLKEKLQVGAKFWFESRNRNHKEL